MAEILHFIPSTPRKAIAREYEISGFEVTLSDGRKFEIATEKDLDKMAKIIRLYGVKFIETTEEEVYS